MGFHYVGQAGLELLSSNDLPASASQSPGIIGMSTASSLITVSMEKLFHGPEELTHFKNYSF